jgi:hypothetical protein
MHHHARLQVHERDRYRVMLDRDDGGAHIAVEARETSAFPAGSVFRSL